MFGQYGNFMNEPTAHLAQQFGTTALRHGQEYLEQNVRCPGLSLFTVGKLTRRR